MASLIDGKQISQDIKDELREKVRKYKESGKEIALAVIQVGNDPASSVYVNNKKKACEYIGIKSVAFELPEETQQDELLKLIDELNADQGIQGILVQLPLPKHMNENLIINRINPLKDVDGFHPVNLGKLLIGEDTLVSCTPKGIMKILDSLEEEIAGKNAVVIGRSRIVGKPIACLLLNRGATVTICHSKTKNLEEFTRKADILVVAVGEARLIKANMVKRGSTIIDVGINRINGKIIGDVDTQNVLAVAKHITPVPGGVGLTTVLSLMENVVKVSKNRN